ncbi:MAG: hypothetical protein ACLPID_14260 [Beijerinckiaceae bacterium]
MSGNIGENAALRVLLTGFSAFPGAHSNPTEVLVATLRGRKAYFARCGIRLELRLLPAVYSAIEPAMAKLVDAFFPDIILHFGLAARRSCISIEALARNRVNQIRCDAAGRQAEQASILRGGKFFAKASVPTAEIVAALRQAGFACALSNDAGDYVCNAAFYRSLATPHAAHVGFVHVPRLRPPNRPRYGKRNRQNLTMARLQHAAEVIILIAARAARRNRQSPRTYRAAAQLNAMCETLS